METYDEALKWIHGIQAFGKKPGLKRMEWMMEKLEHPEKKLSIIHVTGTNGKGSTVAFIRHLLESQGKIVGTFTSPYIEIFNERISVNGEPISNEEILKLANKIYPLTKELEKTALGGPSEFEVITTMMLYYFSKEPIDVAVIEVGIGGLLDSTNVVTPEVSVITTIGMDHMVLLGNTLSDIATQKAGIIKPKIPVVTGNIREESLKIIQQKADETKSILYKYQEDYSVSNWHTLPEWGEQFVYEDETMLLKPIRISMLGKHQVENAAVAIKTVQVYSEKTGIILNHEKMLIGLKKAFWPGRMEKIADNPMIVLDGAHNVPGIKRVIETINKNFFQQQLIVLFGALKSKEVDQMISLLNSLANVQVILTTFDHEGAVTEKEHKEAGGDAAEFISPWQLALAQSMERVDEEGLILVIGSLYFISEVRNELFDESTKGE